MMGGFGGFGMLLWLVLIVLGVYWIVQVTTHKAQPGSASRQTRAPRDVLDDRLARGEITIEQHRELRKALD